MFLSLFLLLAGYFLFRRLATNSYDLLRAIFNTEQPGRFYMWALLQSLCLLAAIILTCVILWRYLP